MTIPLPRGISLYRGIVGDLRGRAAVISEYGLRVDKVAVVGTNLMDLEVTLSALIPDPNEVKALMDELRTDENVKGADPKYFKSGVPGKELEGWVLDQKPPLEKILEEDLDVLKIHRNIIRVDETQGISVAVQWYYDSYYLQIPPSEPIDSRGRVVDKSYDPLFHRSLMMAEIPKRKFDLIGTMADTFLQFANPKYRNAGQVFRVEVGLLSMVKDPKRFFELAWDKYMAVTRQDYEAAARYRDQITAMLPTK